MSITPKAPALKARRDLGYATLLELTASQAFNLALIQLGQTTANKRDNLNHARDMIRTAAASKPKPDLVVLPECFNSPYGASFFPAYAEYIGYTGALYDIASSKSESVQMLSEIAKETGVWLIGGSIPECDPAEGDIKSYYNTTTVYSPKGELVATHRKVHLFDIDIPGKIKFKAGYFMLLIMSRDSQIRQESETLTGGNSTSYFDTEWGRVGLGICYDVRFPELAMISARQGCHILVYPGAFNLTTGPLHWELLQRSRAVDNQVFFAMASPARDLGASYHAWGHSMIVDPLGKVVAEADEKESIVCAHIDPAVFYETRAGIPVTTQRRFDVYRDVNS